MAEAHAVSKELRGTVPVSASTNPNPEALHDTTSEVEFVDIDITAKP